MDEENRQKLDVILYYKDIYRTHIIFFWFHTFFVLKWKDRKFFRGMKKIK